MSWILIEQPHILQSVLLKEQVIPHEFLIFMCVLNGFSPFVMRFVCLFPYMYLCSNVNSQHWRCFSFSVTRTEETGESLGLHSTHMQSHTAMLCENKLKSIDYLIFTWHHAWQERCKQHNPSRNTKKVNNTTLHFLLQDRTPESPLLPRHSSTLANSRTVAG